MNQYHPRYAACAVINSKTGRVLAFASHQEPGTPMVGSRLFLRNVFPAASIYKTITAAAAIETARYTADTKVPLSGRSHTLYKSQLRKNIYSLKEIPFEDAYAQSINPVFGRIGMYGIGKKTFEEYNERFGFNATIPFELQTDTSKVTVPDDTTYEMAQLASGYNRKTSIFTLHGALIASAVAEGGFMPSPRLVDSIADSNGTCLYRSVAAAWKTPISDSTAAELKAMMGQVVDSGTARKTFRLLKKCNGADLLECGGKNRLHQGRQPRQHRMVHRLCGKEGRSRRPPGARRGNRPWRQFNRPLPFYRRRNLQETPLPAANRTAPPAALRQGACTTRHHPVQSSN